MATFDTLAQMFADHFEARTRTNGDRFDCLKDDAPGWMADAMREAHGGMMPDDWRYSAARSIVEAITDGADPDDMNETLGGLVDVYTGRLTAWLASHGERVAYCDEAAAEYGPFDSVERLIMAGQYRELEEIAGALIQAIRDEESDDDDA